MNSKTIICDIDGCIIHHHGQGLSGQVVFEPWLINGSKRIQGKFDEWERKGYYIILMTGRKECMRTETEDFLRSQGLYYDQLIMGVGGNPRYLINDIRPDGKKTAFAINIERNRGIDKIDNLDKWVS